MLFSSNANYLTGKVAPIGVHVQNIILKYKAVSGLSNVRENAREFIMILLLITVFFSIMFYDALLITS